MSSGFFSHHFFTSFEFANHRDNQWPFLCPFSLCCLSTVRAATSSARLPYRPDFLAASLMCSYWRCSFAPTPRTCLFSGIFTSVLMQSFSCHPAPTVCQKASSVVDVLLGH